MSAVACAAIAPSSITYVAPETTKHVATANLTIEEKIVTRAEEVGYNPTRALAIAKAESSLRPNAKNPKSTASGVFQFLDGTFEHYCIGVYSLADSMLQKNDPDIQIECALQMLSEGGESHWNASKHVWGKSS